MDGGERNCIRPSRLGLEKENKKTIAFVKGDKPKMFKGLQIKYVRGSDPVLKLLDDNGNISEELSILKWNTDSVEEFLSEKLDPI
ncbi:selenoprotein F-like [Stigmatopora argus]